MICPLPQQLGATPTKAQLEQYVKDTLASGKVGWGCSILAAMGMGS